MSHITDVELIVKDLDALDKACTKMGGTLVRDAKEYIWYAGQKKKCFAAIRFPGCAYEVGVIKSGDANNPTYKLEADFWSSGGLSQKIGVNGERLANHYGAQLSKKHYEPLGYMLDITETATGDLKVTCSK